MAETGNVVDAGRSGAGQERARTGAARGSQALIETAPASAPVRRAVGHWHVMRGDRPIPLRRALDPVDIPTLLPHSELIEVLGPPLDFRYRLIGDVIDRMSPDYYAGMRVSEIPGQQPPSRVFDLYSETVRRGSPVCVTLPYVGEDQLIDCVEVVTMPLTEDGSRITTLWGVVMPAERVPDDG